MKKLLALLITLCLCCFTTQHVFAVGGDDCGSATVIGGLPYSDAGNSCGFADNYGGSCGLGGGIDVVYTYTPASNEVVDITLCAGTTFDTDLYVFQGCGAEIACNDQFCGNASELDGVGLTGGTQYFFVVDGWSSGGCGDYTIDINLDPCTGITPVNDECTGAVVQALTTGVPVTVFGDGTCATVDPSLGYKAVWEACTVSSASNCNQLTVSYCGTSPALGTVFVTVSGSCPPSTFPTGWYGDNVTSQYENTSCGDGNYTVTFPNIPNGTYYIPVIQDPSVGVTPGPYELTMVSNDCPPAPANDDCSGAVPVLLVSGVPVTEFGDNTGATADGCNYTMPTVWHAVTLPECMTLVVSYCGNVPGRFGDSWIIINPSCPQSCFGDIFATTFNNTACGDGNWTNEWDNLAAGTYYVPILSEESGWNTEGPYSVTFTGTDCPPPPANDDVCSAQVTFCGDFQVESTSGATPESGLPTGCVGGVDYDGTQGVWFRYVGDGQAVTASFCGSNYDTKVQVYDAATGSCTLNSCVMSNDDASPFGFCGNFFPAYYNSLLTFNTFLGSDYLICVNGYFGATGTFNMSITCAPPCVAPVNDDCSGAIPVVLTSGIPVTEFGDNTCATADGCNYTYPTVWHAVTLTGACNNLTVSYCGNAPGVAGNAWIIINPSCPQSCFGDIFNNGYDNTSCGDGNWTVYYNGLAAGTYYIPVMGDYPGYNTPGPYQVTFESIDCPPPPPNDDCSGAVPVVLTNGVPVTEFGDNTGATPDCGYEATFPTVWHAVTLTGACNNLTVSYCGNDPSRFGDVWIIINPSCPTACFGDIFNTSFNQTECGDGNWSVHFDGLAAGTYYVPILSQEAGWNTEGPYQVTFETNDCPPPPPNDDCSGAVPVLLSCDVPVTEFGNSAGATPDCGYYNEPTVWHAVTLPNCGDLKVDYCGNGPGVAGNVWIIINPTCPLTCFGDIFNSSYNNSDCGDGNYTIFYNGLAAGTYYVPVMGAYPGYNNGGPYQVTFTLQNCCLPPPPNDNVCNAIDVSGMITKYSLGSTGVNCVDIMGYNTGASIEGGEPNPVFGPPNAFWETNIDNTIWYKFVAPSCTSLGYHFQITTNNAGTDVGAPNRDTQIALYNSPNGSCDMTQFVLVGSNDDDDFFGHDCDDNSSAVYASTIDANLIDPVFGSGQPAGPALLTPGATYYIQEDGYSTLVGNIDLTVTFWPDTPTAVLGIPSANTINSSWSNAGANNYDIYLFDVVNGGYAQKLNQTSFAYTWMNLQPATLYAFQVKNACLAAGMNNYYSPLRYITTDPSVCTPFAAGPTCDIITDHSITMSWTSIPAAIKYKVYKRKVGQNGYQVISNVVATTYTWPSLLGGTQYEFWVQAICYTGGNDLNPTSPHTFCTTTGSPKLANNDSKPSNYEYDFNGSHYTNWDPANLSFDFNNDVTNVDIVNGQLMITDQNGNALDANSDDTFSIYPNPANNSATIELNLAAAGDVTIKVYDVQGKLVKNITVNESAASMTYTLDLTDLSSGMYNVMVSQGNNVQTKKLAVIK